MKKKTKEMKIRNRRNTVGEIEEKEEKEDFKKRIGKPVREKIRKKKRR